jgi:4-hydroxy-4-methyl-2-oxoglutarate aldolase
MGIVVRQIPRTDKSVADAFASFGVATVHEAQGRSGLMAARITPIYPGAHVSGTAVTVSVPPADNWMLHVAVEQCQEGDVLVVAPTSPSDAGYFGELLATALHTRGVRGLVIDAGCRDVAELRPLGFPVVCADQWVRPGDVVVADDDGVVVVPRGRAGKVLEACGAREEREAQSRKRYQAGELSLDVHGMREELADKGLTYVDQAPDD